MKNIFLVESKQKVFFLERSKSDIVDVWWEGIIGRGQQYYCNFLCQPVRIYMGTAQDTKLM